MKNAIIVFILIFPVISSYAQVRDDLKEQVIKSFQSEIKNTDLSPSEVLTIIQKERLQGPAAKNYQRWRDNSRNNYSAVSTSSRGKLMGPAAKNYQHWRDNNRESNGFVKLDKGPRLMGPAAKNRKP